MCTGTLGTKAHCSSSNGTLSKLKRVLCWHERTSVGLKCLYVGLAGPSDGLRCTAGGSLGLSVVQ